VSHMCSRTITLERGKVIYDGDTEQAINAYLDSLLRHSSGFADTIRAGTGEVRVTDIEILDSSGVEQQVFDVGDCVKIRIHYAASRPVDSPVFNLAIYRLGGEQITGIRTDVDGVDVGTLHGTGYFDITIPNFNLLPNVYSMDAVIFHKDGYTFYDRVNKVAQLKVRGGAHINGTVYLPHSWCQGGGTKSVLPAIASAQPTL
jgi:lipopolysaccharide transport system ATP-binding protein